MGLSSTHNTIYSLTCEIILSAKAALQQQNMPSGSLANVVNKENLSNLC